MATPARAAAGNVRVRRATSADLPQMLDLVLTSFRQFPLFDYLYAPLRKDLSGARDTRFYWRRRFQLAMLRPSAAVLVAETSAPLPAAAELATRRADAPDHVRESWRMLEWLQGRRGARGAGPAEGTPQICGWAVWMVRKGCREERAQSGVEEAGQGWWAWFRSESRRGASLNFGLSGGSAVLMEPARLIALELAFWSLVYRRRDQDSVRYQRYSDSEDELEAKFYPEASYYLDNVCVDFRRQRSGIGKLLVAWGVDEARRRGLPATTEAGPMGEGTGELPFWRHGEANMLIGLYRKLGFREAGTWSVPTPDLEHGSMDMPVLRLE